MVEKDRESLLEEIKFENTLTLDQAFVNALEIYKNDTYNEYLFEEVSHIFFLLLSSGQCTALQVNQYYNSVKETRKNRKIADLFKADQDLLIVLKKKTLIKFTNLIQEGLRQISDMTVEKRERRVTICLMAPFEELNIDIYSDDIVIPKKVLEESPVEEKVAEVKKKRKRVRNKKGNKKQVATNKVTINGPDNSNINTMEAQEIIIRKLGIIRDGLLMKGSQLPENFGSLIQEISLEFWEFIFDIDYYKIRFLREQIFLCEASSALMTMELANFTRILTEKYAKFTPSKIKQIKQRDNLLSAKPVKNYYLEMFKFPDSRKERLTDCGLSGIAFDLASVLYDLAIGEAHLDYKERLDEISVRYVAVFRTDYLFYHTEADSVYKKAFEIATRYSERILQEELSQNDKTILLYQSIHVSTEVVFTFSRSFEELILNVHLLEKIEKVLVVKPEDNKSGKLVKMFRPYLELVLSCLTSYTDQGLLKIVVGQEGAFFNEAQLVANTISRETFEYALQRPKKRKNV